MATRTVMTSGRRNTRQQESDEFDGYWLNIGPETENEDGEVQFSRLNRGVAVSDLTTRKIYENMSDEFKGEVAITNEVVEALREACPDLEEGEGIKVNLAVYLYRRQEGVEVAPTAKKSEIKAKLFGKAS